MKIKEKWKHKEVTEIISTKIYTTSDGEEFEIYAERKEHQREIAVDEINNTMRIPELDNIVPLSWQEKDWDNATWYKIKKRSEFMWLHDVFTDENNFGELQFPAQYPAYICVISAGYEEYYHIDLTEEISRIREFLEKFNISLYISDMAISSRINERS